VSGLATRIRRIIGSATVPDVMFIMSGINNIASEEFGIVDEYRQIIKRIKMAYPSATIVVQSILPVNLSWIDNASIEEINRALRSMSGELKVEFLDLYGSFIDPEGYTQLDLLVDDGVHVSEKGYEVWSGKVSEFLDYLPKKSSSSRSSSSRE
jgi:lysophospholipase L1-like esterase